MRHVEMLQRGGHSNREHMDLALRATGQFYTPEVIGRHLVHALLKNLKMGTGSTFKMIDPFCGDGRLICWLITEIANKEKFDMTNLEVHLWDYDGDGLKKARQNLRKLKQELGLSLPVYFEQCDSFTRAPSYFGQFDLTITNPPWENIKPDRRELSFLTPADKEEYICRIKAFSQTLARSFPESLSQRNFSGWGTNLARCGMEAALKLISQHGICAIVLPASILADQVSSKIRTWLFTNHIIRDVAYFPAEARLFNNVDQPAVTLVTEFGKVERLRCSITGYSPEGRVASETKMDIPLDQLEGEGFILPVHFGAAPLQFLGRWSSFPRFEDLEGKRPEDLWAGRELDETGYKNFISDHGDYLFLKGQMIDRFCTLEKPVKFVAPSGPKVPITADHHRIAWRDVSRPNQKRRLHATLVPPGIVTGNSLGIAYFRDDNLVRLKALLGIMNSFVFEFQLRSRLSTAHVSLSSVRKVRIPKLDNVDTIECLSALVDRGLLEDRQAAIQLEAKVAQLYELRYEEFAQVLTSFKKVTSVEIEEIMSEYTNLLKTQDKESVTIANHYSASLSELDLLMVRAIPPGGNWKDIPESIPSKRLEQIRRGFSLGNGSRSTYYGRLQPDLPSYTITTFFNRPGNGCNVHYDYEGGQHRVLSQREAARLQSFPDTFVFHGNRSAVNDQIGNAVPPLLSYQIAKSIPFVGQYLDLFSGAGGLSLGFKWAGWQPLLGTDVNRMFLETYRANIHHEAILGDISDPIVLDGLIGRINELRSGADNSPFVVLGGPPCQGFSTAGCHRSMADKRNWLFSYFKAILEALRPALFIFENVPGLLNMESGRVFEMIRKELESTGMSLTVWKLNAVDYAIPQRRTRLIIVGRRELKPVIETPRPVTALTARKTLFESLPGAISVRDALADLPPLAPGEDGSHKNYVSAPSHPYQAFMRSYLTPEQYLQAIQEGSYNSSSKVPLT